MRFESATSVGMRVKNRLASPLSLSLHFHFGIGIFSPSEREKSLARKLAQNPAERGSPARSLYREVYDAAAPECEPDKNAKAEWNRERKRGNKFLCQVWNGSGRKRQGCCCCAAVRSYVSRPTAAPIHFEFQIKFHSFSQMETGKGIWKSERLRRFRNRIRFTEKSPAQTDSFISFQGEIRREMLNA